MSEREQLVESAAKFLQLPQVQSKNFQQKIEFLKSKGLSHCEVEKALKLVHQSKENTELYKECSDPKVESEQTAQVKQVWENAEETQESRGNGWQNILAFAEPEMNKWRNCFFVTAGTLGSVCGLYRLIKGSSKNEHDGSTNTSTHTGNEQLSSKKSSSLELDRTSLNHYYPFSEVQIAEVTSDTVTLKEHLGILGVSIRNLQKQAAVRDQEFKRLGEQLDELRYSIPQMLENQKSTQHAMVASLHDDLKALKTLLIRRSTPINSPHITPIQAHTQTRSNPPLITKDR